VERKVMVINVHNEISLQNIQE